MLNYFSKLNFQRLGVLFFTSLAILGTAGSCSLPNLTGSNKPQTVYGVLKKDPEIRPDGFLRANTVEQLDGSTDSQGLSGLSTLKLLRVNKDLIFALTKEKGLFKSEDGGQIWKRIYTLPVGSSNQDAGARQREIDGQVKSNDNLDLIDFAVDPLNPSLIYVSLLEDKIGKIFQSFDSGQTFKEIYSEVDPNVQIQFLAVDPLNSSNIFAILEKGALLRSLDGGLTWQKVRSFRDTPVQIGFVPEFGGLFFALFEKQGLAISTDFGTTWNTQTLTKNPSSIGEVQGRNGLDASFNDKATFGRFEKIIPITAGIKVDRQTKVVTNLSAKNGWILLADKQIWYSQDTKEPFTKLVLPLQSEKADIYDITFDPNTGLDRILASVDNRLFITTNRGQSWSTQDNINLSSPVGNISQIVIDAENTEIIYLGLIDPKAKRENGLFVL